MGIVAWLDRLRGRSQVRSECAYSFALADRGEVTIRARSMVPVSEAQWRQFRIEAVRLAAILQPSGAPSGMMEVHALGPLTVLRDGQVVTGWGGPKAGNRQALAMFAFLLDRGERGANRDEIVELIWPEVDLARADIAFHRTLGGLRRMLAGGDAALQKQAIVYRDGVYRLDMTLVQWTDVTEFERHLLMIEGEADVPTLEAHLEAARALYRGDYMDDCPIYGDSSHVEFRRQLLRDRYVGALRTVAEAREQVGRRAAAAHLLSEAWAVAGRPGQDELRVARAVSSVA